MLLGRLFFGSLIGILAGNLSANILPVGTCCDTLNSDGQFIGQASDGLRNDESVTPKKVEGSNPSAFLQDSLNLHPLKKEKREEIKQKIKKTGNIFVRFIRSFNAMDTAYITPNYYNYTAMLQNTNFRQDFRLRGTNEQEQTQIIHLSPEPAFKVGPYFGWRWIFFGYTFDMGHPKKAGKSTEFSLSLYSSMLGADLVYIKNNGDFNIKRIDGFGKTKLENTNFGGFSTYTACINAYYVFNHKRFSYPAAFAQSTVQRKSCGSWILGLRFDKQKMRFDYEKLPDELLHPTQPGGISLIDELKFRKVNYNQYSVSGGYAYNWVFARNCLLSLSVVPAVGYKQAKGERISGEKFWVNIKNLNIDFITRAGLVWNNTKWFAGASFVNHLYDYRKDKLSLTNSVSYLNIYFGFCFNRKKEYR